MNAQKIGLGELMILKHIGLSCMRNGEISSCIGVVLGVGGVSARFRGGLECECRSLRSRKHRALLTAVLVSSSTPLCSVDDV